MIVGTAGHVDHGKTTLVRALTGVDTDRLPEEKVRGISIELGFAYASFADDDGSDAEPIGFVDVPGHRRFVQTMIAGAAGIDVGLLVVAADDGPMPQTREHVDVLQWLGVARVIVALTKVDVVDDERRTAATAEVAALLDATRYRGAPTIPVSARSGEGLPALVAAIRERRALDDAARDTAPDTVHDPAHDRHRFRLAIDRAFVLKGIGLVVTGTCFAGRVAIDDRLTLLPGGLEARVRTIHAQGRPVSHAHAGQRVALNLVGRGVDQGTVHRGDWMVDPTLAFEVDRIDVGLIGDASVVDARDWRHVRFHAGATAVGARVTRLDDGSALAQIVFERPIHVLAGDRFVLRDPGGADGATGSVAGGVVLDVDVPTRGRRGAARLGHLALAAAGDARATLLDAIDTSVRGIDLDRWNRTHGTAFDAASLPVRAVSGGGSNVTAFAPALWASLIDRVVDVLADEHRRTPDAVGPGRDRLRRMSVPSMSPAIFASLIDAAKAEGRVVQTGAWLHRADHRVELSTVDSQRFERMKPLLGGASEPNYPPRVRDLAKALADDEATVRHLCIRLASQGALYRVAHDHYFLPDTVERLARAAADVAADDGVARAAAFRDRIGVGRKVAIQILEFFDRVGYTRRIGDDHRVVQPTLFDP